MSEITLSRMIDHTLLKADARKEDINQIGGGGKAYKFASVCVNPAWVAVAHEVYEGGHQRLR